MAPRSRSKPVANVDIANLLRKIRDDAGVTSASKAGELISVSQATVSRWESGRQVPTPEDADWYARELRAPSDVRRQLVAMVQDLHQQHRAPTPTQMSLAQSAAHERRVLRNEKRAVRISWFHPLLLPGTLQIPDYVRAVMSSGALSPEQIEERVTARLERAKVIDETYRQFTFVLTYGSLGWRVGNPDVMVTQIDHIVQASQRPNVRIGVVPWGTEVGVFPPCGFDIYDHTAVVVGVVGGAEYYNDRKRVALYVKMFAKLEQLALFGDEARAELRRIADEYRDLEE
jgi:transcriptional regulator with XRE-family HTH domain